jgi:hypothetical protein
MEAAIAKFLMENEMTPALPYTQPRTKDVFYKKHDYVYDEYYDCSLCPAGEILKISNIKEGYREYKSPKYICAACAFLAQCTESKDHQKVVAGHFRKGYEEEVDHLTPEASKRGKRDLCEAHGNN